MGAQNYHEDSFKEFTEDEYNLIENSYIFSGYKYSRKRSAYQARVNSLGEINKNEWHEMVAFFDFKCCRCECEVVGKEPTKDHIIAIAMGGTNSIRNLQPLCRGCNLSKGYEIIDHRTIWCERNNIEFPKKWRLVL